MAVGATPAAPGVGMSGQQAQTWVIVSAVTVAGIYAYRRIQDPAAPAQGKAKNVAGVGTPVPTGQFVTAWGVTFLIVSMLAEADPGLGGGFALIILVADLLTNAQAVFGEVTTAVTPPKTTPPATASSATPAGSSAGFAPIVPTGATPAPIEAPN